MHSFITISPNDVNSILILCLASPLNDNNDPITMPLYVSCINMSHVDVRLVTLAKDFPTNKRVIGCSSWGFYWSESLSMPILAWRCARNYDYLLVFLSLFFDLTSLKILSILYLHNDVIVTSWRPVINVSKHACFTYLIACVDMLERRFLFVSMIFWVADRINAILFSNTATQIYHIETPKNHLFSTSARFVTPWLDVITWIRKR